MPEKIFVKFMLTQQLLFFLENSYIKFHKNVTNGLTTDLGHQQQFTVSTVSFMN